MGKLKKISKYLLLTIVTSLFLLPFFIKSNFGKMKFEELLFVLLGNQAGANMDIVWKFIKLLVLAMTIIILFFSLLSFIFKSFKNGESKVVMYLTSVVSHISFKIVLSFTALSLLVVMFEKNFSIFSYFERRQNASTLFEEYYRDPDDVELIFPSEKRNLIYIVLESISNGMNSSLLNSNEDRTNLIPNLSEMLTKGDSFSHTNKVGGGLRMMYGSTNTMSSLVGHTSGIPLIGPINANGFGKHGVFLPGVTSIGDVLEKNGYKNYFSIGSDKGFAHRDLYFETHGNYEIFDLNHWYDIGKVPEGYNVFWGIEDLKLFDYSKEILLEISKNDEPFNFTMLTVDSHFMDGYTDVSCPTTYAQPYANAIKCSDALIYDFIEWVKVQDFYENTTVVLVSDHTTMNANFLEVTDIKDTSLFNVILNANVESGDGVWFNRKASVLDMFPTTLRALNVEISGDRLGLGTDLYSNTPTLQEELGFDTYNNQLGLKSNYYESNFFRRKK